MTINDSMHLAPQPSPTPMHLFLIKISSHSAVSLQLSSAECWCWLAWYGALQLQPTWAALLSRRAYCASHANFKNEREISRLAPTVNTVYLSQYQCQNWGTLNFICLYSHSSWVWNASLASALLITEQCDGEGRNCKYMSGWVSWVVGTVLLPYLGQIYL